MSDLDSERFQHLVDQYPVHLPQELLAFWRLVQGYRPDGPLEAFAHEAIGVRLSGPFALLASGQLKDDSWKADRHPLDPAEFFVVAESTVDAYRWGYWFDEPDASPLVVRYDTEETPIRGIVAGAHLTGALVRHLESTAERLEEDMQYDPDGADYYKEGLSEVSGARQALVEFATAQGLSLTARREREVVAPTVDGLGIVALRESFTELLPVAELQRALSRGDQGQLLERAEGLLKEGYPATSLQVGKALYGSSADQDTRSRAAELMAKSYEALSRSPLARVVRDQAKM